MRKRSWDGVHRVGTDLIVLYAIVLPAGEISPRHLTFMILSLVLFENARQGRIFAQVSSQYEFGSLQHCIIPLVRQFLFLKRGSSNFI